MNFKSRAVRGEGTNLWFPDLCSLEILSSTDSYPLVGTPGAGMFGVAPGAVVEWYVVVLGVDTYRLGEWCVSFIVGLVLSCP